MNSTPPATVATVAEAVAAWRAGTARRRPIPIPALGAVWRGVQARMNTREIAGALGVSRSAVKMAMDAYGMQSHVPAGRPCRDRVTPAVDLLEDQPFSLADIF